MLIFKCLRPYKQGNSMMRALLKEFAGSNKRFEKKEEGRPIFLKRKAKQQLVWLKAPWYLKFFWVNLITITVLAIVNIFIMTSFHLSEISKMPSILFVVYLSAAIWMQQSKTKRWGYSIWKHLNVLGLALGAITIAFI